MQTRTDRLVQVTLSVKSDFTAMDTAFAEQQRKIDAERDRIDADHAVILKDIAKLEKEILASHYGKLRVSLLRLEKSVGEVDRNQEQFDIISEEAYSYQKQISQRLEVTSQILDPVMPELSEGLKVKPILDALQRSECYKKYIDLADKLGALTVVPVDHLKDGLAVVEKMMAKEKKPGVFATKNKKIAWDNVTKQYARVKKLVEEDINSYDAQEKSKKSLLSVKRLLCNRIESHREQADGILDYYASNPSSAKSSVSKNSNPTQVAFFPSSPTTTVDASMMDADGAPRFR